MLRCLEKNPVKRATSALRVAAAFPCGDPLAATLVTGETPSPEMVPDPQLLALQVKSRLMWPGLQLVQGLVLVSILS